MAMLRSAATLSIQLEQMSARAARGELNDNTRLVKLSGALHRVLRGLGIAGLEGPPVDDAGPPPPSRASIEDLLR